MSTHTDTERETERQRDREQRDREQRTERQRTERQRTERQRDREVQPNPPLLLQVHRLPLQLDMGG